MRSLTLAVAATGVLMAVCAAAQDRATGQAPQGSQEDSLVVPTEGGNVVVTPGSTSVTDIYVPPRGPPGADVDINAGLPSSSRPTANTASSGDGFDLIPRSTGPIVLRGREGSTAVLDDTDGSSSPMAAVPKLHTVRRGDTLWDLCARYYGNPWAWPKLWSYNAQIHNPHWIYPGDQIRLAAPTPRGKDKHGEPASPAASNQGARQGSVYLRNVGILDDPDKGVWGELVGAREDQMLLGQGNRVYLKMRPGVDVSVGQKLTLFGSSRPVGKVPGARQPKGQIVPVKGTVLIDHYNPRTHIARGEIVESVDVIERGNKLGQVRRKLDLVPPRPSHSNLRARVLTSVYPYVFMSDQQVVFLDRGSQDGLVPGNRLFVVRRGDAWRHSLKDASSMARDRMRLDVPEPVQVEDTPLHGDEKAFPDEVIAELRVVRTNPSSSVALVTSSQREVMSGDRAEARKGY